MTGEHRHPGRGKATALIAALIAVLLGAYLPLSGARGRWRGEVAVYQVERQPFAHRVPAQGNLRAAHATPINVPVDAPGPFRIAWVAPDGTPVKAGEVVVRFDPTDIEKLIRDAEDDLRSARLRLEKERVEGGAALRKLEHDLQMARVELDNARQFQKKDETIYSRHDIIESEIDSTLAKEREKQSREASRSQGNLTGTEQELLAIQMRQASTKIERARRAMAGLEIRAPHDGVLVLSRDWNGQPTRIGDSVWNGQTLAEIPELASLQAEVYVLEADAGGLAAGKPATVSIDSKPGESYPGKVSRVDSLARPRMRGSPVQYFAVTVDLERTRPAVMKPGQRVRADLLLEERKDALVVPRQAVFERDGRQVVYRQTGDGFEPVEVQLGPSGMGRVVIESGLAPGDVIALADPSRKPEDPAAKEAEGTKGPSAPGVAPLP